jgi:hypothetical protein
VVGVEQNESGALEVFTKVAGSKSDTFSLTAFRTSDDSLQASASKTTKLNLTQLLQKEVDYSIDLDGDGEFGNTVTEVLFAGADFDLYLTKAGSLVIGSGLQDGEVLIEPNVTLMSGTEARPKAWSVPPKSEVVAVLETNVGYEVIWQDARAKLNKQSFKEGGLIDGRAKSLRNADIVALERALDMDLSEDGFVGAVVNAKLKNITWEVEGGSVYSLYFDSSNWSTANRKAQALGGSLAVLDTKEELFDVYDVVMGELQDLLPLDGLGPAKASSLSKAKAGGALAKNTEIPATDLLTFTWVGATVQGPKKAEEWRWTDKEGSDVDEELPIYGGALTTKGGLSLSLGHGNLLEPEVSDNSGLLDAPLVELVGSSKLFYIVEFSS